MRRALLCAPLTLLVFACSDSGPSSTCATAEDCTGGTGENQSPTLSLSCVDGQCVQLCEIDLDCQADPRDSTQIEMDNLAGKQNPNARKVCTNLRCVDGCTNPGHDESTGIPANACATGETCGANRRCAFFAESFEPEPGEAPPWSLERLRSTCRTGGDDPATCSSWDRDLPREKKNNKSDLYWEGIEGCGIETEDKKCAGPAAQGIQYLIMQRVAPPVIPSAEFDTTCRACKCCADCLDGVFNEDDPNNPDDLLLTCDAYNFSIPRIPRMCQDPNLPECAAACTSCQNECVPSGRTPDEIAMSGLNQCQVQVAERTCQECKTYQDCLGNARPSCPDCQVADPTAAQVEACNQCVLGACSAEELPCTVCERAEAEFSDCPNCPDIWGPLADECNAQAGGGCAKSAVSIARSELTDAEQALISPRVDLSQADGDVILQFQYIPFNIGDVYRPNTQSEEAPQELLVQFCGQGCETESNWMAAVGRNGSPLAIPSADERNNGLAFAGQTRTEWTVNVVSLPIPEALRTAEFRFRFVPRLSEDGQIAVDNIFIRRR